MNTTPSVNELSLVVARFSELAEQVDKKKKQRLLSEIGSFTTKFKEQWKQHLSKERISSTEYNVFDILHITRYEAWVHTPFLANLLDENGSHMQGRLFIGKLLQALFPEIDTAAITNLWIQDEHHTWNGIIDLFIEFKYKSKRYYAIIENKIDAIDQHKQLERYHNFLTSTLKPDPGNYKIIYLTPHGTSPFDHAIGSDLYTRLKTSGAFVEWSYTKNISAILSSTLDSILSERVKHTVIQYIKTINAL